jgi:hypothetical protein
MLCILQSGQAQVTRWIKLNQNNYQLFYPENWNYDSSNKSVAFFLKSKLVSDTDSFSENVNLIVQDISNYDLNLDSYAELSKKQINSMMAHSVILSGEKIKASGGTYYRIIFTAEQEGLKLKFIQHYYIKQKKAYVLTFTSLESTFDQYATVAQRILSSFLLR